MANKLDRPEPPVLPYVGSVFSRDFFSQTFNILRLFFNRITNAVNQLSSRDDGGKFIYSPRALYYDTTIQQAASANTGYPITFNSTYINSTVSLVDNSKITVLADGVYSFQIGVQLYKHAGTTCHFFMWIVKNGTAQPYGTKQYTVKVGDYFNVSWDFIYELKADDYVEIYWATDSTDLRLESVTATSPHSGIPSAVASVVFASNA